MKYKRKKPVEIAGYKNAMIPTFDHRQNCVVDKCLSWANDPYDEDDFLRWDDEEGSEIPPF